MSENIVLRKNPDMVARVIDNEVILMPVYRTSKEINCIYTLNKVGSRVWELIDNKRSLSAIKKEVLKEFDATPKEVEKEMAKFLKDLLEIKAIN